MPTTTHMGDRVTSEEFLAYLAASSSTRELASALAEVVLRRRAGERRADRVTAGV